jgi:hypothetical protein
LAQGEIQAMMPLVFERHIELDRVHHEHQQKQGFQHHNLGKKRSPDRVAHYTLGNFLCLLITDNHKQDMAILSRFRLAYFQ